MPLFSVAPEVFDRFPDYVVGWVIVRNAQNIGAKPAITNLLSGAEDRARLLYTDHDLKAEPPIAVWRSAFSSLSWSASKYPASVEAMVKRVARGGTLPHVNSAVDLANAATLLYLVPVGCHDLDLAPDLCVRTATGEDSFIPMGGADTEIPQAGETVYATGNSVRTRRWVWRQSREALVSADAGTLLFAVDGFAASTLSRVEAATEFLTTVCGEHLSPNVTSGIVSRAQPEAD